MVKKKGKSRWGLDAVLTIRIPQWVKTRLAEEGPFRGYSASGMARVMLMNAVSPPEKQIFFHEIDNSPEAKKKVLVCAPRSGATREIAV